MTNSVLAKMAVIISAQTAEFNRKMAQSQNSIKKFTGFINSMAGTLGVAFSVQQVASFAVEISRLSGEAEGVRAAFEKLPDSVQLMNELKEATGETVSELDLMKRAVQASNFDISLQALPRLLEFAAVRAQQTGQSVDYLVDSIVTGIGRKSKLILDNLGISAVALDEKLGGVSVAAASVGQVADAVGKIAEENLAKMGKLSDNNATKMQRLGAEWENLKVALGGNATELGLFNEGLEVTISLMKNLVTFLKSDGADVLEKWLKLATIIPVSVVKGANAAIEALNEEMSLEEGLKEFNEKWDGMWAGVDLKATQEKGMRVLQRSFTEEMEELGAIAEREGKKLILLRDELGRIELLIKPFTNTVTNAVAHAESIPRIALIPGIKQQIEEFKKLQNEAFSPEQVEFYTSKIRELQDQLKRLTSEPYNLSIRLDDKGVFGGFLKDVEGGQNKAFSDLDERLNNAMSAFQEDFAKQQADRTQRFINHTQMMADAAVTMGTTVGEAFGSVLNGHEDFLQGMARITGKIIEMYLAQSIAAMIKASIDDPSTPFPLAKVATAAVGIGLVKSLFSQIGATSVGTTGVSGTALPQHAGSLKVSISGKLSGYDMSLMEDRTAYRRSRVG